MKSRARSLSFDAQIDEELLEEAFKLDDEAVRNSTPKRHVKEFFLALRDTQRKNLKYAEELIARRPEWNKLEPIVNDVFDDDDGIAEENNMKSRARSLSFDGPGRTPSLI